MRIRVLLLIICSLGIQIQINNGKPSVPVVSNESQNSRAATEDLSREIDSSDVPVPDSNFGKENENLTEWTEREVDRQMTEIKSELKRDEWCVVFILIGLFIMPCLIKGSWILARKWIGKSRPPNMHKQKGSDNNSTSKEKRKSGSPSKRSRDKSTQKVKTKTVLLTVPLPNLSEKVKCDIEANV